MVTLWTVNERPSWSVTSLAQTAIETAWPRSVAMGPILRTGPAFLSPLRAPLPLAWGVSAVAWWASSEGDITVVSVGGGVGVAVAWGASAGLSGFFLRGVIVSPVVRTNFAVN